MPRTTCDTIGDAMLPNPRTVRRQFHSDERIEDPQATLLFTLFGQFLSHDISFTPEAEFRGCCEDLKEEACFAMKEVTEDTCKTATVCKGVESDFFSANLVKESVCDLKKCFDFVRSRPFCQDHYRKKNRQQVNGASSYIDASNVYGSQEFHHDQLREAGTPFLRVQGNGLLPDQNGTHGSAGDTRATEVPELSSMHTIFLREHNRIANAILAIDSDYGSDATFDLAREILIAEMQNIVYDQYLTLLMGEATMQEDTYYLDLDTKQKYSYKAKTDVTNAFSTAAFRFGHSMVDGHTTKLDVTTNAEKTSYNTSNNHFFMEQYLENDGLGFEEILNAQLHQQSLKLDTVLDPNLVETLFKNNKGFLGGDLFAKNVQRGRDHGLPGYNDYRYKCGLAKVCTWDEVPEEIDEEQWALFKEIYNHPSDIDLFAAGLAEKPFPGSIVGPTFHCIIGKQFKNLRIGDRFFFNNILGEDASGTGQTQFSEAQIANIRQRHLGNIMCDNTNIAEVSENVFRLDAPRMTCPEASTLDLSLFVN